MFLNKTIYLCCDKSFKRPDDHGFKKYLDEVATEKPLSPQMWQMWGQEEFGWTMLALSNKNLFRPLNINHSRCFFATNVLR